MGIAYLRMDEHQAFPVDPEGSFKSVHGPEPEQAQPQPQVPPTTYPFMQEFIKIMRNVGQPPVGNMIDETYEKIRK